MREELDHTKQRKNISGGGVTQIVPDIALDGDFVSILYRSYKLHLKYDVYVLEFVGNLRF